MTLGLLFDKQGELNPLYAVDLRLRVAFRLIRDNESYARRQDERASTGAGPRRSVW